MPWTNQNWMKPGYILTSMLKRVDLAVYETIKDAKDGKFQSGENVLHHHNYTHLACFEFACHRPRTIGLVLD